MSGEICRMQWLLATMVPMENLRARPTGMSSKCAYFRNKLNYLRIRFAKRGRGIGWVVRLVVRHRSAGSATGAIAGANWIGCPEAAFKIVADSMQPVP